ncbi:bifunctional phosphopantothenoylcysteine decarboxylase/phosphopantothenate synthase [Oryzihumus sp.]|uniref:bifunctional phosphopantothenoylcysteine decarboxylase/phosphopantothenate synthase n=1 Tax=Oryzihumus sp. TaxID=1968903 RepID=UPI002EDA9389
MRVVLGVSGGIAAYKACLLLRLLTESGHDVTVVPTAAALEFVGAPTWAALSGKPVATDVWSAVHEVPHVRLGQQADLVVVAPATADLLARAAHGLADDLLTNTLLTARCPVVLAPAMHTEMWEHAATRANVATLRSRGVHVIEPASGRLTGADTGPGRLPEPEDIFAVCRELLAAAGAAAGAVPGTGEPSATGAVASDLPLAGRRVVVSAGGTREPIDPVRFLGNRSSGKQGFAIAAVAAARGAEVTLVAANADLPVPAGVNVVPVETVLELREAVTTAAKEADVVVMAAAPADFRPAHYSASKIKKSHDPDVPGGDESAPVIELVRNPDVLAELVQARAAASSPVIVGFAAETGDESGTVMDHARAKLERKGCDVLVVNEVGPGKAFGQDDNTVHILQRDGAEPVLAGPAPKEAVAATLWDVIQSRL